MIFILFSVQWPQHTNFTPQIGGLRFIDRTKCLTISNEIRRKKWNREKTVKTVEVNWKITFLCSRARAFSGASRISTKPKYRMRDSYAILLFLKWTRQRIERLSHCECACRIRWLPFWWYLFYCSLSPIAIREWHVILLLFFGLLAFYFFLDVANNCGDCVSDVRQAQSMWLCVFRGCARVYFQAM